MNKPKGFSFFRQHRFWCLGKLVLILLILIFFLSIVSTSKKQPQSLRSANIIPKDVESSIMKAFISPSSIKIMYGTAWKKQRTKDLVSLAIRSGFRAIDTANQPKHYSEILVGQAVNDAIQSGLLSRNDLFLQVVCIYNSYFIRYN